MRKQKVYGTSEDVLAQIELLKEAGIEYLIMNLDSSRELEALDIFADNIIKYQCTYANLSICKCSNSTIEF
jgi:hypothetical protein